MKKRLKIPNEIETIINKIKTSVNIVSISESSGVSTIITDTVQVFNNLSIVMLLKAGMVVTINNKNYVVSNIVDTPAVKSFDVNGTGISVTSWNVAANFKTGTRVEINEVLNLQNNNEFREMKFPFVWLLLPINPDFDHRVLDFQTDLDIVFAQSSNKTDRAQTRIDNNFDLVLNPLLELFLLWVQSSDLSYMFDFQHQVIDYSSQNFPFYGTDDKSKNVLTTTTDAIEVNFKLDFKKQYE